MDEGNPSGPDGEDIPPPAAGPPPGLTSPSPGLAGPPYGSTGPPSGESARYVPPAQGYGPPAQGNGVPAAAGYGSPPPGYVAPAQGYGPPPPPGYASPALGYGPPGPPPPGYWGPSAPPAYGPPGYGAPGYGYHTGVPTSDDRTWAMLSHLSYFVFGIIGPIIIMVTKGKESPFVRDQAVEALNFHITLLIAYAASFILIFVVVGIFTFIAVIIGGTVLAIMASIAGYRGQRYRYPVTLRLVK